MPTDVDLADRIFTLVAPHPAIRGIRLVGSRSDGSATEFSDWDFAVDAVDFGAAAVALPELLAPLHPLVQQWDRLSREWCWMLIVPGPTKVDLIFPGVPRTDEPPWQPGPENLQALDDHFWDWVLWLRSKEAHGKTELITHELSKMFGHLLGPLGVDRQPSNVRDAIAAYLEARDQAERRFGIRVRRELENEIVPLFTDLGWSWSPSTP
jgi:hypothetical protein